MDVEEKQANPEPSLAQQADEKQMDQSRYIIKDESVKKRNRNMFGDIMGHLKKAKATLESEKGKVG